MATTTDTNIGIETLKFIAITGAFCYTYGNTLVSRFKGSRIANLMYVTSNADDTYNVKICKFKNLEIKTIKEVNGVYANMVKLIFKKTTGLSANLKNKKKQAMNKPKAKGNLLPVRDFAASHINRRGFPVSVQYIYKLIDTHKKGGKEPFFKYLDKGKEGIWIIK